MKNSNVKHYRKRLQFLGWFVMAVMLSCCAAFGSKTLYKTTEEVQFQPKKVGYCQVANEKELNQLIGQTGTWYKEGVQETLAKNKVEALEFTLNDYSDFQELQPDSIAKLCKAHELDGFVTGKLRFAFINYSLTVIPIGQSQDTEVEVQYFDSNGNLLIHTSHNTYNGNSYPEMPVATKTVYDGTAGALKKVFKEMKK